jgi:hypothetical protein
VQATTTRPRITATTDGEGVVSHAGSRLLAAVADRTTLTAELSGGLAGLRKPRARLDPGRILGSTVPVGSAHSAPTLGRMWMVLQAQSRSRPAGDRRRPRAAGSAWGDRRHVVCARY